MELGLQRAIGRMTGEIAGILEEAQPSIYLYGSCVLDDFRLGWSDIDILVLTRRQMSERQAQMLVTLRQALLKEEPENPYLRSFEGGMLTLRAFLSGEADRVVYWGTSGERITDAYRFDSFCMYELLGHGALLYGAEVREHMSRPDCAELRGDVKKHYETIRRYAQRTGRDFYSFGWLLDIARGIYTLRTGKVIAKTAAGEWALECGLCPDPGALKAALAVRKNLLRYREDAETMNRAENLGPAVQRFADVLERELRR